MGRKRAPGNERLGEYVQPRSSGILELRFPIPADVRHAFLDKLGRPRTHIIRSIGTKDVKVANARAEEWKTGYRHDFDRVRRAYTHDGLNAFLRGLYDSELATFRKALDHPSLLEERFAAPPAVVAQRRALAAGTRNAHARGARLRRLPRAVGGRRLGR